MTDTKRSLFCPACGAEMSKIFIKSAGCYLDVCLKGCGGIYFDKDELQKINELQGEIPELQQAFENKKFNEIDTEKTRMCPNCSHIMIKDFSTDNGEVEIDECRTCGAIFLDCSELFKIRESIASQEEQTDNCASKLSNLANKFFSKDVLANIINSTVNKK